MKHKYNRKDANELLHLYDTLLKKGIEVHLREIDYLNLINHVAMEYNQNDALEITDFAINRYQFSPRLHTRRAHLLIETGQEVLAFDALDRAEIFGQSFIETDILRAKAHLSLSEVTKARQLIHELKHDYYTTATERSEVLFVEALIFEETNDFEHMYRCLNEAVQFNPFNDEALQKLYIAVELTKRHQESVLLHSAVIDENPYSCTAWFNLAQAHYYLREYHEALEAFEYAFIVNERFEPAYKEYADVCFNLKLYKKALSALEEGLDYFDGDDEMLLKIGQCHQFLGDTEKAKIYYYRALSINKFADEVYFYIGKCYAQNSEFASSIHFFNQAIKLDVHREDYLMELAKAYQAMGRYQKALPLFKKATEMGPELSENWVVYADFILTIGGLEEALEVVKEGEMYAFGADLNYCKAAILFQLDERREAMDALKDALLENYGQSAQFFDYLPNYKEDKAVKAIMRYYEIEA